MKVRELRHRIVRDIRGRRRRLTYSLQEGVEPSSGEPLRVLYSGDQRDLAYIATLAFTGTPEQTSSGTLSLNELTTATREPASYDLAIVTLSPTQRNRLNPQEWVFIPQWITGDTSLPLPTSPQMKRARAADLRRIRKHALSYDVKTDMQDFDDFYDNMYLPFVSGSHQEGTYIHPYKYMRQDFARCRLLRIHEAGTIISGILLDHSTDPVRLWSLGVRDNNREHLKHGAIGGLYHFAFEHLLANGATTVNLGASRAFLNDGVLQYKKKWGQHIRQASPTVFGIRIAKETPAVRSFLGANPFISISNGKLYETRVCQTDALSDDGDPYPGLAGQRLYQLDQPWQPTQ